MAKLYKIVVEMDDGTLKEVTFPFAIPVSLSDLSEDEKHRLVTDTEKSAWNAKAEKKDIPTKISDLEDDSDFLTEVPSEYVTEEELNKKGFLTSVPSEYVTDAELNAKGYLTSETDPTVPAWAKKSTKPTYTSSEVGADAAGTAENKVSAHNVSEEAHNDLRLLIAGLTTRLNSLADSDDTTLDQMSEVVAYIKSNKSLIDAITTNKVSISDIIDNLTTSSSSKPLSAKQGVQLKALIDAIVIPTKTSQLENDSGFMTSFTESDPTVPSWAKNPSKPSYSKSEVGLGNVDNVKQYSASNPPPYPVISVNGKTGAVTISVPTKVSELENDSKFLTSVPSEYVTKTELNSKGYLTQHPDISGKANKSDAEPWTCKMKDGSTVTKKVVLA